MWIRSTLALAFSALVFSVDPPLSTVAQARVTAPGLHVKAYKTGDVSPFWPTDPVLCDLILDGDVEVGDATSLQQKFETIVGNMDHFTFFLCLRSLGGDVREALNIAQFVLNTQRPSIATVIEDGQACASACAIIFLAGNGPATYGALPQRFLHPRGKLLFHSTQLDLSKFSDKDLLAFLTEPTDPRGLKGRILDLYNNGLRDVQSVIAAFQKFIRFGREAVADRWVRPSLFLEMFAQDPDEWTCVDNVDAVGRWNIQVYGYQPPKTPKKQDYFNVCRNAYHWRSDEFAVGAEDDLEMEGDVEKPPASTMLAGRNKSETQFDDRFTMSVQAPYQVLTCVMELNYGTFETQKKRSEAESELTTFFLSPTEGIASGISMLAPTAYFSAATLLRDLPGVRPAPARATSKTGPSVRFTDYPNSVMNGCSYKSIPKMARGACQAACAVDRICQGYSHNKITQTCELKHTLTARRLDPFWTSGAPSLGRTPGRSIRADAMVDYQVPKNIRLQAKLIDEAEIDSLEACSVRCKSDSTCLALEFEESTAVCRRFSEVTGVQKTPADQQVITIRIKRQQ
jgi:hypothetical protein